MSRKAELVSPSPSNAMANDDVVYGRQGGREVQFSVAHLFPKGTFVCNGASAVTVADVNVTATSTILPTVKTVGGTVGATPSVKTTTPGTGFTVAGTASDTSTYNYSIIN